MYVLEAFELSHLIEVANGLREEDLQECFASGFVDPVEAVMVSVAQSDAVHTVFLSGHPVGIYGLVEDGYGNCQVWLVGTPYLLDEPLAFHKASVAVRDSLLSEYSSIYNKIYSGNSGHIKWLTALGASVYPTDDPQFHYFEIER